ncbi:tyrosine recombinase XerC [Phaeobacter italicus]|uniref:site-specific integrase n=1 Tax=Phaeobacter italicus TaxID=481446 RepID=UPI0035195E7B
MGSVTERKRLDGSVGYLAQIDLKRNGKRFRDNRTFEKRLAAEAWIKKREKEVKAFEGDFLTLKQRNKTLADAIDRYVLESQREIGRTKAQVLRTIKEYDIASLKCADIVSPDIVSFAQELAIGKEPATVSNYLSHLSSIFAIAKPAWGVPLDGQAMKDAMVVCSRLGLSGKSRKRDRRPSLAELDALLDHFQVATASNPRTLPMHKIVLFALFSTRRESEITRILHSDLDPEYGRVFIRDMKHPGAKLGNDVWCDLPRRALDVALSMPLSPDGRVFPFNPDTISSRFTRACKVLDIRDLRFHDLRHEGASHLFELGYSIPQAAAVTGHRSWSSLQRYTHLQQTGDKFEGWKWVSRIN